MSQRCTAAASSRRTLLAVAALTAVGLALRVWQLGALRLLIDEGNSIDNLFRARAGDAAFLLPPNQYVTTLLHPTLQAWVVDLAGPTLAGLRLSSALLGAATIPALWWLARGLFDARTALLAAAVLVAFPPHLHFSRLGLPHILDALLGTLALAAAAAALASGRRATWAVAGVALGLTHYGFEGGRWFYTPLLTGWLALLALLRPDHLRAARGGLGVAALACALTVAPVYVSGLVAGADLAPRLRTSAFGAETLAAMRADPARLLERLSIAARVYTTQHELAEYYGGDRGLLLAPVAPLAVLGMLLALRRPRAPGILVPLWLIAAWAANSVMQNVAVTARWAVVFPGLALAVAVGLAALLAWLPRRVAPLATAVVALGLGVGHAAYYFGVHVDRLAVQARAAKPYRDAVDAALRAAAALPGRGAILVVSEPPVDVHPVRSLLRLLTDGADSISFAAVAPDGLQDALAALPDDRAVAFFVAPADRGSAAALAACFALDGPHGSAHGVAPERELAMYLAPRGSRRPACSPALPSAASGP